MNRLKFLLAAGVLGLFAVAVAATGARALTPAGTEIRNQSVATYTDALGRPQTSTSNEVITTVSPVYALEILPDTVPGLTAPGVFTEAPALTQSAAAGNTVYYSYTLRNLGNAPDTFDLQYFVNAGETAPSSVRIYQDVNGDGQVDPGDRLLNDNVAGWGATPTFEVPAGAVINLLVAVGVPAGADDGDLIEVDIDARTTGVPVETDAVSNFSRTTVTNLGVLTASKSASPVSAAGGATVTYTLTGSNTGNAAVYGRSMAGLPVVNIGGVVQDFGLLIRDEFEAGKYDLTTLGNVSHGPAAATVVYLDGAVWTDVAPAAPEGIGLFIATTAAGVPGGVALASGQSYSLQFSIDLDAGLVDGLVENNFLINYHNGAETRSVTSNTTLVAIAGPGSVVPGVALGPSGDPLLGFPPGNDDGQQEDGTSDADYEDLDGNVADAGSVVTFTNTVRNTGNLADTFNITIVGNTTGATVLLYKSDGLTPLADTSGDGIPDTGPVAPGADANIVVRVLIPANADQALKSFVQLRATTVNVDIVGDSRSNDTYNVLGPIRPAGVDVATTGFTGDGDPTNDTPAPQDIAPGGFVDFPLDIRNIRALFPDPLDPDPATLQTGAVDTYNLAVTGLPAGWTAVIYHDAGNIGVLDPDELLPISNTSDLDPGDIYQVIVRLFAPEGAVAANIDTIEFTATSTNNPGISDSVALEVDVLAAPGVKITPDNAAVALRGGTYTYRHVVTNTGNVTEDLDLSAAFPPGSAWSYTFVDENGVNLGPTPTVQQYTGGLQLAPGASVEVFVKVFVPGNAPVGSTELLVVTVTATDPPGSGVSDDAVDATTVVDGNLQLTKTRDQASVAPTRSDAGAGEFYPITYTTEYRNLGAAQVTDVVVIDAIPAFTRVVVETNAGNGVTEPSAGVEYSNDGGLNWGYVPSAGADHTDPAVTHVRWVIGDVDGGASGTVEFQVLVD